MNSVNRFRFRNTMLIANVISNIIGVTVVFYLFSRTGTMHSDSRSSLFATIDLIFIPLSFIIPIAITLIYERPIRSYLERRHNGLATSAVLTDQVQQRLLNEPFFLMALNALVWISAAVTYALYFWRLGLDQKAIIGAF